MTDSYWPVPHCSWDSHSMWGFDFVQMMEKGFSVFTISSLVQGWLLEDKWGEGFTWSERGAGINCCLYYTGCLEAPDNFRMPHTLIVYAPKKCYLILNVIAEDAKYSLFTERDTRPEALQKMSFFLLSCATVSGTPRPHKTSVSQ